MVISFVRIYALTTERLTRIIMRDLVSNFTSLLRNDKGEEMLAISSFKGNYHK